MKTHYLGKNLMLKGFVGFLLLSLSFLSFAEEKKSTDIVKVWLNTSEGDIYLELDKKNAPGTVENFVRYVDEKFYEGTIFHRVISGFMIQGGGFTPEMTKKETHEPIVNEAGNGLLNKKGTIAMARTMKPHTATSQFYINLVDNAFLDQSKQRFGYTVFGKVTKGMDVVEKIGKAKTILQNNQKNAPVKPIVIKTVSIMK